MTDNGTGALSLHLGLCGALADTGPRYLPCADRNDPAITDEPEVITADDAESETTPVQSGSRTGLFDSNMQERKDEIDALRARVDVILNKMVQNSGDDVTRLRQKIAEMRTGPPQPSPTTPTAPTVASKPWNVPAATIATKPWNPSDPKNCPLSPMTATTNATQNTTNTGATNNSATPSADTELHANLSIKKQPIVKRAEGSILTTTIADEDDERDDDDDDIDDMEFDFKVAPLSVSKSVQMDELGAISAPPTKKEAKDPPASLKASESMLPDPGGDESYCSHDGSGSRCESPPPGSVLYEAAARKAESVVGREIEEQLMQQQWRQQQLMKEQEERERQDELEKEQLQQQLLETQRLLKQQKERLRQKQLQETRKQRPPSPEQNGDFQSRSSKTTLNSARTCPVPEMISSRQAPHRPGSITQPRSPPMAHSWQQPTRQQPRPAPRVVQPALVQPKTQPQVQTAPKPEPVEIIDADESEEIKRIVNPLARVSDPPGTPVGKRPTVEIAPKPQVERSKSPPPPVANVNIPHIVQPTKPNTAASVASHSDSSLTRPPSPTPAGDVTMVEEVSEQRIRDPYGDKGLYTGVLVKRRPHGRGTMKYDDGRHYEGHWNHGRWHGVGRAIFANNDIFEGSYDMDQRHGHGMYQWNDGRVYTGQFFQDQRQGRGTYTWPDGAVYQGEFKAGHRHGQGMYRFADGSVYTGEWESGKYHGVGECRWSDGRSYRGEWKEGRANGYGVETRPNGTIRHDGEWKDDRPVRDHSKKNTPNEALAK